MQMCPDKLSEGLGLGLSLGNGTWMTRFPCSVLQCDVILLAMPKTVHMVSVISFIGVRYGSPSGPVGGGGVGCLAHEGHPAKDPLGDGVLVIDDIHERRLACLHETHIVDEITA
jgi:hypothetical protein